MDRNSVIGLVLIGLLLAAYTIYQRPSEAELAAQKRAQDSIAALQLEEAKAISEANTVSSQPGEESEMALIADSLMNDSTALAEENQRLRARYGALANSAEQEGEIIEIETDLLRLKFNTKGGIISSAELKEFSTYDSLPLILFDEKSATMGYAFTYPSYGEFNTSDFNFTTKASSQNLSGDQELIVEFRLQIDGGRYMTNTYVVKGNAYDVGFETRFNDLGGLVTSPKLKWEMSGYPNEKGIKAERNKSTIFYKEVDKGRDFLSEASDDEEELDDEETQWIAFKQNFFSAILIADNPLEKGVKLKSYPYEEEVDSLTQFYSAVVPIESAGTGTVLKGSLFMGPNDYKILKPYGMELDRVINLGWGIFGWVNKYIVIKIFDFLEGTGMSYGIIILILTLFIKLILSPLTFKNFLSSAKMRVLKPEVDEINEKYKDADAAKKQQATMELYRKTGVNPFAGCIPMLFQLPILYAMFQFFPSSIQLRHESFLWADDLSAYDSIMSLPFEIPFYGDHVSLFTLLMCISTFFYTLLNSSNMPTQSQPGMPNMKVITYIFPFMMLFFFNSFASGLSYYYLLANLMSIIQMIVIKRFFIDEDKIKMQIAENKKKKAKQGKSKFQQKLEEMAKQRGMNT